jgi:hypothetical protein
MSAMKNHPAYRDAKHGDTKAARSLVKAFFKPEALSAGMTTRVDYVVPVMQLDVGERWNALPLEFARTAARNLQARILPLIVQDNVVHHTGADSIHRITEQPSFTGKVLPGNYLIVDDVVTLGSTLANLRGWIECNGGHVARASTLSSAIFSTKLIPDRSTMAGITARFHHDLPTFTQRVGFPVECLTNREAHFVHALKNLIAFRSPQAAPKNSVGVAI